jgi:hypothetical protein
MTGVDADRGRMTGYVTRARLTQIMNLLLLSPDIQEFCCSRPAWRAFLSAGSEPRLSKSIGGPSERPQVR